MKVKPIHFVIFASVIFVFSCRKTPENPVGGNKIEIGQSVVDNIGYFDSKITTTITDLGGNIISQHGHCWSLTENPTIANFKTAKGKISQATSFFSDLTSLTPNTKYDIRPYLTYTQGTVYGSQLSFTTLQTGKPVIITKEITDITLYAAISGGNVTSDGGLMVTQRGICWSTEQDFDLATSLSRTSNGTGNGIYVSNLSDLHEGTTYYVKAYAINSAGTGYGEDRSFKTFDLSPCDSIASFIYGGKTYKTVEIGYQCWMAENLNIGTQINTSQDMQDNATIEKYCYDDTEADCDIYGGLYQWDEMMQYTTSESTQGICPDKWHVPSDDEWKQLEMALGMSQSEADDTGYRGTDEGKKMKSTNGWISNGNGTNSSGFNALPGGYRDSSGSFDYLDYGGYWWSSSEGSSSTAWDRRLYYSLDFVYRDYYDKEHGFSVRCLKD
jgi:uncharacterized protein (TIGR02145 family)